MSAPKLTKYEKQTDLLKRRIHGHIAAWWPKYEKIPTNNREFNYIFSEGEYELVSCEFTDDPMTPIIPLDDSDTLWFLWNNKELTSYDDAEDAFVDLLQSQKEKRLRANLKYYTSPLAVSAGLAFTLVILIAALEYGKTEVPPQLWTVFTAVIAFYFGKGGSGKKAGQSGD